MWITAFTGIVLFFSSPSNGEKMSTEQYIDQYREAAMANMRQTGVPASITLAQGILESGAGNSPLAREANNHFGIKCHKEWNGPTYIQDDDEKDECFRKYEDALQSYLDHAHFLTSRPRYKGLFELDITDYKGWAHGLKAAGYATNPNYAQILIGLIERYELHRYDLMVIAGETPENMQETQLLTAMDEVPPARSNNRQSARKEADPQRAEVITSATTTNAESGNSPARIFTVAPKKEHSDAPVRSRTTYINGLRVVIAGSDDNVASICERFGLNERQLAKYNDWELHHTIEPGMIVFIEPKRNAAEKGKDSHLVQQGDTWHSISQTYGVSLKWLYKRNETDGQTQPAPGSTVRLRS